MILLSFFVLQMIKQTNRNPIKCKIFDVKTISKPKLLTRISTGSVSKPSNHIETQQSLCNHPQRISILSPAEITHFTCNASVKFKACHLAQLSNLIYKKGISQRISKRVCNSTVNAQMPQKGREKEIKGPPLSVSFFPRQVNEVERVTLMSGTLIRD